MTSSLGRCFVITDVCGSYTLKQGVAVVGIISLLLSSVTLFISLGYLNSSAAKGQGYNADSVKAFNLMFALIASSTCSYSIVISALLLLFLRYSFLRKHVFLLTLWVVSNINLMILHFFLLLTRTIVYYSAGRYAQAHFTYIFGVFYEVIFIYFTMIVNSYELSIDPHTIYY